MAEAIESARGVADGIQVVAVGVDDDGAVVAPKRKYRAHQRPARHRPWLSASAGIRPGQRSGRRRQRGEVPGQQLARSVATTRRRRIGLSAAIAALRSDQVSCHRSEETSMPRRILSTASCTLILAGGVATAFARVVEPVGHAAAHVAGHMNRAAHDVRCDDGIADRARFAPAGSGAPTDRLGDVRQRSRGEQVNAATGALGEPAKQLRARIADAPRWRCSRRTRCPASDRRCCGCRRGTRSRRQVRIGNRELGQTALHEQAARELDRLARQTSAVAGDRDAEQLDPPWQVLLAHVRDGCGIVVVHVGIDDERGGICRPMRVRQHGPRQHECGDTHEVIERASLLMTFLLGAKPAEAYPVAQRRQVPSAGGVSTCRTSRASARSPTCSCLRRHGRCG
jgi:hypothetical protein